MKIINTKLEDHFIIFEVEIPTVEMEDAENKALKSISQTAEIKGYRKGQVPVSLLRNRVDKNYLQQQTLRILSNEKFTEIENSNEWKKIDKTITNTCTVDVKELNPKGNSILLFKYEEYPEITVGDYKKLKLPPANFKISDEEFEQKVKFFLKRNETITPLTENDKVSKDNLVQIDFACWIENSAPRKLKDWQVEVKNPKYIIDFEKHIINKKIGDKFEYDVKFPSDYFVSEFRDKKGKIEIAVKKIFKIEIPELTDEFVKQINIPTINTKKEFLAQYRKDLETEKQTQYKQTNLNLIYKQLVDISKISFYPELYLRQELPNVIESYERQLESKRVKLDQYLQKMSLTRQQFELQMLQELSQNFFIENILLEIAEKEKITVTDKNIEDFYFNVSISTNQPIEAVKKNFKNLDVVKTNICNNLVLDKLIEINVKSK